MSGSYTKLLRDTRNRSSDGQMVNLNGSSRRQRKHRPILRESHPGLSPFYYGAHLVLLRSRIAARQLLRASIVFLPLEFLILVLGKH